MIAPLVVRGELFGILSIHRPAETTTFDSAEANFVQILLKKAALHIENTALYESLYNNLVNTLNSLVQAIEAKDPYTRLHSQRVTLYACGIAETLGLGEREMEALRFASPLHDIGKIGISDAILLKNGRPTEEEFATIRRHPELGAKILEPLGLLADEQSIILYHHERWDGRGYPSGRAGGDIPLLARIVTVADAYDAMTSDRIYRRARSHAMALEELLAHSARQFDPAVVEGFVRYAETANLH
jgi:HD-GYP domain-containing protein (c-di-GMP phosphodiesterase class II)